jgi:hypothetical protein
MTEPPGALPTADSELWSLLDTFVDGTATPAQRDQLETRLRAEPRARQFYVAYLDLHAALQWRTRGEAAPRPRPARRRWALPFGTVAAAGIVLALGLLALRSYQPGTEDGDLPELPDAPPGAVAVLIGNPQTVWEPDMRLPTATGAPLPPGRLKLKAGVVEIAFRSGGEVLLEGPADLDVRAPDRAFLHKGKLTANVPQGAEALRLDMPGVAVTDRAGECGLLCDETGRSEVHVFAGQVDADPTDGAGAPRPGTRLHGGGGARLDAERQTLMPVPLNAEAFAHLRPDIRVIEASVRGGQFAQRPFPTAGLLVKHSIADYTWESYLCFDLSGVKGKVSEARVRLVPVRVGMPLVNAAALAADTAWAEATLTWDSRPASGPVLATWTAVAGQAVEFDVTRQVHEALAADRRLSLCLFAPQLKRGNSLVQYGSRKGEAESRPQLLVTIEP